MATSNHRGFTLIELLVVTSIIGIMVSIAIPQYAQYRAQGFNSKLTSAIRHVATGEENYFILAGTYSSNPADVAEMTLDTDVSLTITAGNSGNLNTSFKIVGTHPRASHSYEWVSDPAPGQPNFTEH